MAPRFDVELRGVVTVVGSTAKLSAKVIGHPTPTIEWYKDDKEVLHGGRLRFEESPDGEITLVARDVRLTDQGRYKCVATNRLGKDFSSSSLIVTGKPITGIFSIFSKLNMLSSLGYTLRLQVKLCCKT